MNFKIILSVWVLGTFSACTTTTITKDQIKETNKIVFHFHDKSVRPEYHRSYKIEITDHNSKCTVDSYGHVISSKDTVVTPALLSDLKLILGSTKIENCENSNDHGGCTGGTGESLILLNGGNVLFKDDIYYCGNHVYGKLCGTMLTKIKSKISCGAPFHFGQE
jgi:hypothetical protein